MPGFHHLLLRTAAPVFVLLLAACTPPGNETTTEEASPPRRIVAIGDIHGDMDAARVALRLGGAIDEEGHWAGGDMVLVQTGDILDRGDEEEAITELFLRLQEEARAAGGEVHLLNGNHELMNAYLDFRYVTDGGFEDFEGSPETPLPDSVRAGLDPHQIARAEAFGPGGPMAQLMAERKTALLLDSNLFVHGGVLPDHVEMGLEVMNGTIQEWLRGEAPQPEWIRGDRSPVWTRLYSDEPTVAACDTLAMVLERLGAERMVVGHTVQRTGITAYCGGRVWCIDVGLAAHYGGRPEVLEIQGERVRSLR